MQDSCGDGRHRGGVGIDRSFKTRGAMTLTMHGDRAEVTPFGLAGGTNGGPNILAVRRAATPDVEEELGMHAMGIQLEAGDHVIYRSNGGGGFGDPVERDPSSVLADVTAGWVSQGKAEKISGIALVAADGKLEIDAAAPLSGREALQSRARNYGYGWGEVHPLGEGVRVPEAAE